MQASQEVDLKSTGKKAIRVGLGLVAWTGEVLLLNSLWATHKTPTGAEMSSYLMPIVHIVPWIAAMKWFRTVRNAINGGTIEATEADRCYRIIDDMLVTAYSALTLIESTAGAWKF